MPDVHYGGKVELGMVTGADMSPDGSSIFVRTHETVWELDMRGLSLWDLPNAPKTEIPVAYEPQGEAIAYDPTRRNLWHISEGPGKTLYFLECEF
mmetsp:Transcript_11431/g.15587  ORF Transcript_11431/g.15587 Transcript_11431/m.15587 type:complete len:95 (+) Transcript_11431:355-639(+)